MSVPSTSADYAAVPQPVLTATTVGTVERTDVGAGRPLRAPHGGLVASSYRQIAAPILVVHGDADPAVPVDHSRRVLDAVPAAAGLILPGAGQLALFTHLGAVRDKVAAFLHL